jgi:hypothetical protein
MIKTILATLVALVLALPAEGAIAEVASVCTKSTTTDTVTTSAINTTGATLFVIAISDFDGVGYTVSDSQSNTWDTTPSTYTVTGGFFQLEFQFAIVTATNASHTFSATCSGCYPSVCVIAFSGTHATTVWDGKENGSEGAASTRQPGSITPTQDNAVVVSALALPYEDIGTITISGGGFSAVEGQVVGGGGSYGVAIAYVVQTTATASNPTWEWDGGADPTGATIAAFREAAGGGGGGGLPPGSLGLLGIGR